MWYVIQVRTGTEESIRLQCGKLINRAAMERCFILYCEEMKRYHGEWHKEKKILFPGYLFVISQDVEALFLGLKKRTYKTTWQRKRDRSFNNGRRMFFETDRQ